MNTNMVLVWVVFFIVMMIGFYKVIIPLNYTSKLGVFLLIIGAIGYVGIPIWGIVVDILGRS